MSGASNELGIGVESERMSQISAHRGIAFPRSVLNVAVVCIVERDLIRLRPDDSAKRPLRLSSGGDPHAGCCGEGRLITAPYPIMVHLSWTLIWLTPHVPPAKMSNVIIVTLAPPYPRTGVNIVKKIEKATAFLGYPFVLKPK